MKKELITIAVLARNEEKSIRKTLTSISRQILPKDIETEVLVVCNGCSDNTARAAREFSRQGQPKINVIEVKKAGKAHAWNIARNAANAEIIVFCDADVAMKRDAIGRLVENLRREPKLKACGAYVTPAGKRIFKGIPGLYQEKKPTALSGALYAVKKSAARMIPEHVKCAEDLWLSLHLGLENIRIDKNAVVFVKPPATIKDFMAQNARWHYGGKTVREEFGIKKTPPEKRKRGIILGKLVRGKATIEDLLYVPVMAAAIAKGKIAHKKRKPPQWKTLKSTKI